MVLMPEPPISAQRAGEFWRVVKENNNRLRDPYPFEKFPEFYALGIILSTYPTAVGKDGKLSVLGAKKIVGLLRSEADNYKRREATQRTSVSPIGVFEIDDLIDPTGHIRELYASIANALGEKLTGGENMGELTNRVKENIAALKEREDGLGKREGALKTYEQDATSGLYNAVEPHWKSAPVPTDGEGLKQYAERLTGGLAEMIKGVAVEKADVKEAADVIKAYLEKQ